jgi:hypothetical protein
MSVGSCMPIALADAINNGVVRITDGLGRKTQRKRMKGQIAPCGERQRGGSAFRTGVAGRALRVAFCPMTGSWLNLVEGFFSKLARSVLRQIRVTSLLSG